MVFFPEILPKTSPTARPASSDYSEKHERHFNPSEAFPSICNKLFTQQASLIMKTCIVHKSAGYKLASTQRREKKELC